MTPPNAGRYAHLPFDPTDRASYAFWSTDVIRYGDEDEQGHVNNAVVSTFCETGRVAFMRAARPPGDTGRVNWVVARVTIDFLDEMHFPGTVEIGTRLVEIRRSSMTLVQGLFHAGACRAVSEAVAVRFDPVGRGALPIDEALRERLAAVGRNSSAI